MFAGLQPYPAMKDSGVPWLECVPDHWEVKPVRRMGLVHGGKALAASAPGDQRPYLRVANVFDGFIDTRQVHTMPFTETEFRRYKLEPNDVLLNEGQSRELVGRAARYTGHPSDCAFQNSLIRVRAHNGASPKFLELLFRHAQAVGIFATIATQTTSIAHLGVSRLADLHLPLPTISEQRAIVQFLNYANRRIQRYIRAKQQLIKLLEEQKRAIINRAVTRGLDPNVRLRPSGVKWLGKVPEHWGVTQLRRLISFVTSGSRGWAEFFSDEGDYFLQSGNLGRSMELDLSFVQRVQPPRGAEGDRTKVERGDLLLCITGALTGNAVHVAENSLPPNASSFVNQHVALIRPVPALVVPRYLAYVLHSEMGRIQFKAGEYGGTKQGLGLNDVKSAIVTLPPISEQVAICQEADAAAIRHAASSDAISRGIALAREYRTRLIADVVAGNLDVRNLAARLPDESEEPEPLDEAESMIEATDSQGDDLDAVPEDVEA